MQKLIVEEICKNLKWHERIIAKIFVNTFVKVYKLGITFGFNSK